VQTCPGSSPRSAAGAASASSSSASESDSEPEPEEPQLPAAACPVAEVALIFLSLVTPYKHCALHERRRHLLVAVAGCRQRAGDALGLADALCEGAGLARVAGAVRWIQYIFSATLI
jgi:hypothetical protein